MYDTAPLQNTLHSTLNGYFQSFQQSPISCAFSVTDLTRGNKEFWYKMPKGQALPDAAQKMKGVWSPIPSTEMLVQALMGSTALPLLFPPYESHFDGGVLLTQPITPAIALGALNLYVIVPAAKKLGQTTSLSTIATTLLTTWLSASMISQIENVRLRNEIRGITDDPKIRLCVIRPEQDIGEQFGITLLSFGKAVSEMVAFGERAAQHRLDNFYPDNEDTWYDV